MKELKNLLMSVNLGGIIDQCVINTVNKTSTVRAVDQNNILYVSSTQDGIDIPDKEIGLSEIGKIIKVLDKFVNCSVKVGEKTLVLSDEVSSYKVPIINPEYISTCVSNPIEQDNKFRGIIETGIKIPISNEVIEKIGYFCSLRKAEELSIFIESSNIYIGTIGNTSEGFQTKLGENTASFDTFSIRTKYLINPINYLGEGAIIYIIPANKLVVITPNEGTNPFWAVSGVS